MAEMPDKNPLAGLLSDPGALASLMQIAQGLIGSVPTAAADASARADASAASDASAAADASAASEPQGKPFPEAASEAGTVLAASEPPPAPMPGSEPDAPSLPVGALGLPPGIPGLHTPANRNRDALLCALKPYLAPSRAERLDRILRLWQLAQMLGSVRRYL